MDGASVSLLVGDFEGSVSFLVQVLLRPVPDMEHMHGIPLDGEQDAEDIPPRAIEQLPDFFSKMPALRRERAPRREVFQRVDRFDKPDKPPGSGLGSVFRPVEIGGL